MTTPIDRESVEVLAQIFSQERDAFTAKTLLALRAALDAAEADRDAAVAAALREAAESTNAWVRRAMHLSPYGYEIEREHGHMAQSASNAILAMIPDAGSALDRALAAERERLLNAADTLGYECEGCGRICGNPDKDLAILRKAGARACCPERKMRPLSAAFRAQGET